MTQQQQEIAVFEIPTVSYQDSQIHKDLLSLAKGNIKKHVIEKEDEIAKIGKLQYRIYRPRSVVSIRKIYKRKGFSEKA